MVLIASGAGQRVRKYIHKFREKYFVSSKEMVVLAELMLRGAETVGEIRNRASRMEMLDSLDTVHEILNELMTQREEPLVMEIPRQPGQKESRFMHLLAGTPDVSLFPAAGSSDAAADTKYSTQERLNTMETEIEILKEEISELKQQFKKFKSQFE